MNAAIHRVFSLIDFKIMMKEEEFKKSNSDRRGLLLTCSNQFIESIYLLYL